MLESLQAFLFAHENAWVLRLFGVVLATATLALLVRTVLDRIQRRLERTHTLWDDAAVVASRSFAISRRVILPGSSLPIGLRSIRQTGITSMMLLVRNTSSASSS